MQRGREFNSRRPRKERKRLLIVAEGPKTEVQYLEGLAQYLRATGATIRGTRLKGIGRDPQKVVQAARDIYEQDPDDKYDQVWVLVDVDRHTTLDDAIADANRLGYSLVVSNPCFEIWLIWHYEDCNSHHSTEQAHRRVKRNGHVDRAIPNSFPFDLHPDATKRAKGGQQPGSCGPNPSTGMPHLLAALQS